jgi:hypothetical protein
MIKPKDKLVKILTSIGLLVFIWVLVTISIQRFKCTNMSETELLIYIPQAFICDWKICE